MACPFFEPLEPLVEEGFCPTERVTLGAVYRGRCAQGPMPPDSAGFRTCNRGYARHTCPNFPPEAPVDAYRFAKVAAGGTRWIEERDHRPLSFADEIPEDATAPLALQFAAFQNSIKEGKI